MRIIYLLLLALFGCADNEDHCERSVSRINEAREACDMTLLSAESMCFGYESIEDVDCRDYFACESSRYSCVDGELVQDLERCPPCE